jgi:hypothetical protein
VIAKTWTETRTPSALVHEVDEWATVIEKGKAPASGIECDECHQVVKAGAKLFIYWYWDLLGPEFVCPGCKPEHDRRDAEHGYGNTED